ncbi:histidine kinase [Paenibacillus sp. P96]|uniref:histidine kinase n=1 Tax=Paenibacillus zeirhizosphaerae TaxID=2987519 RepID=A0ABT9FMV8_9BACL|nr:histidine kinase [Paenibacillus sp. P96]MDP4096043.1 histidine kinase [Paenibacillus sp. P96]
MTYRQIKWMILTIPTIIVGLWEYVRHQFLMPVISMDTGNWLTPLILFVVSVTLLSRLFTLMEASRAELERERAARDVLQAREMLARELHDGIAQSLFLLSVKMDKAERSLSSDVAATQWSGIRKTLHEVDRYVRQSISNLRDLPLHPARSTLPSMLQRIRGTADDVYPQASVEWDITDEALTARDQAELLACIREALLNARKHAQASRISIRGSAEGQQGWRLLVEDNGRGFQGDPLNRADRYGLRITKERAEQMGWRFTFERRKEMTVMEISKGGQAN